MKSVLVYVVFLSNMMSISCGDKLQHELATLPVDAISGQASISSQKQEFFYRDFREYNGPHMQAVPIQSKYVWAVVPIHNYDWNHVKMAYLPIIAAQGNEYAVSHNDKIVYVPSAFVFEAKTVPTFTTQTVLYATLRTSVYGKVTKLCTPQSEIEISYRFAGEVIEDKKVSTHLVLPVNNQRKFGHPVVYKHENKRSTGSLIYQDNVWTWVVGFMGKPIRVHTKEVIFSDMRVPFINGQMVAARYFSDELLPAHVLSCQSMQLTCEVTFDHQPNKIQVLPFYQIYHATLL